MHCFSRFAALTFVVLLLQTASAQLVTEKPPALPSSLFFTSLDGGRTQSIAVNPTNSSEIVIATQFGGLWKTTDGTAHWTHLSGLTSVFINDVSYSPNGTRLIATLARDNQVVSGAGIYVSDDGGETWVRPGTGLIPTDATSPPRGDAYGISYAPDDPARVYVGTSYGFATSNNGGNTWTHLKVRSSSGAADRLQEADFCVQGLNGNHVLLMSRDGILDYDVSARTFRRVSRISGGFTEGNGLHRADLSPWDSNIVFAQIDYDRLLVYNCSAFTASIIPLPGGSSRYPFVRLSRQFAEGKFFIWAGCGVTLQRLACNDLADALDTVITDWVAVGRENGLHDDTGYMGISAAKLPVLYGSDGGVFKPASFDFLTWRRAANPGSGMNSYQISDLAGTDYADRTRSVYFTTQDNGIWSSPDNATTWTGAAWAEGTALKVPARSNAPEGAQMAYATAGYGYPIRFSQGNLQDQRDVPNLSSAGDTIDGLSWAHRLGEGLWLRFRFVAATNPEIYVSTDRGDTWRRRANISITMYGIPRVTRSAGWFPEIYCPAATSDNPAIGLIRVRDLFSGGVEMINESSLIRLPDGGSLGIRMTEFDWPAVFGVDPRDPEFLIVPDVVNSVMKISRDGGDTWTTDTALTNLVTKSGQLKMYDGDATHMQVIQITFDPHRPGRVLIGTRDAGVIVSEDSGATWYTVPTSERIVYATGFDFSLDNRIHVGSYGRGLWELDMRYRLTVFPFLVWNSGNAFGSIVRLWNETAPIQEEIDWDGLDVTLVLDGQLNGVSLKDGEIKGLGLTKGSQFTRYVGKDGKYPEFLIYETDQGSGFAGIPAAEEALKNGEFISAVILKDGQPYAILSALKPFSDPAFDPLPIPIDESKPTGVNNPEPTDPNPPLKPHLFVTTSFHAGLPMLAPDSLLFLRMAGIKPNSSLFDLRYDIAIDGVVVSKGPSAKQNKSDVVILKVPTWLSPGGHEVSVIFRKALNGQDLVFRARFSNGTSDEAEPAFSEPEEPTLRSSPPRSKPLRRSKV